jgi:hypothetical protein
MNQNSDKKNFTIESLSNVKASGNKDITLNVLFWDLCLQSIVGIFCNRNH